MIGGFQVGPFQLAFQQEGGTVVVVDTHDGFDNIRDKEIKRKKDELRAQIRAAIDGPQRQEAIKVVLPYVTSQEPIEVASFDLEALMADVQAMREIQAFTRSAQERRLRLMREDEEILLLL